MRAAANGTPISCTLVGAGPYRAKLEELARQNASLFAFRDSLPIDEIRSLMRQHDVYVLSSDGGDGWGAVVSEALEEGMLVIGSEEAGSTATILPTECRFACRDDKRLAHLLEKAAAGQIPRIPIGDLSAARAVERLCAMIAK